MEIRESEQRRARNLIWNAAADYSFEPEFKTYDARGRADLYWNSVVGAVRRNYGPGAMDPLFQSFSGCEDEELYEQLVWLGLENAVFQREADRRPALPALRLRYARDVLEAEAPPGMDPLLRALQTAHFRRALGEDPAVDDALRTRLDALEFSGGWDGETLCAQALALLHSWYGFVPGETQAAEAARRHRRRLILFGPRDRQGGLSAIRSFGYGYGQHTRSDGGGADVPPPERRLTDRNAAQSAEALRHYIAAYFGQPLFDQRTMTELERTLCVDEHRGCHLYYARGGSELAPGLRGYAASQRRGALRQMEQNVAAYRADEVRHRNTILRLSTRIRNAMLAYLQPTTVRTSAGALDAGRVWRGVYLRDDKLFTRVLQSDPGELCVELLLDGSTSQLHRQESVAAQGYMIAESLNRCGIPVRVSSFCSLSGYTILTRYRDYGETDRNDQIFHYFTTGCNRDGLAIRALGLGMEDAPCDHRLVILLSDAKPNDVMKLCRSDGLADYAGQDGIQNTAAEVRSLLHRDIAVICVFTGEDEDVPAAHTIYGRNFARIRSLDQFADTVGTLIQNQIHAL